MWHEADAMLAAIFHAARQSFKHELLVDNFAGTPILQQHGSGDENVPVYHSRLMHQLAGPGRTRYVELLGEPHWRDGVLETKPLLEFYNATAEKPCQLLPWNFSLVVPPAAVVGAKGGIKAGQLLTPGRAGRIDVAREDGETWRLRTRNIKSFHVELSQRVPFPSKIYIDQGNTAFDLKTPGRNETVYFANSLGNWRIAASHDLSSPEHRSGRQIGALDAILRSKGPIMIYTSFGIKGNAIACQVSRNLLQYYGADSRHTQSHAEAINGNTGNVITIAVGGDLPPSMISSFPIHVLNGSLVIASQLSGLAATYPFSPGLFAAFLRPLANERLELVFWGADKAGLQHAARLLPMLTGVGQPDFVVGTKEHCALQGAAGLKAAGFFDWEWKIGKESYVSE
ncbi:hypothetical protein KEM55_008673 [Ascosphaera atra]|nr:hypothetical protein KEM55_008673 [Ascosphaera atra]